MNYLLRRVAILFLLVLLLIGCASNPYHGPEHFAKSVDVFASARNGSLPEGGPSDSKLQIVYDAPYEDVFRTAKVSAAQAQLFVEEANKDKGVIFAVQSKKVGSHINNYIESTLSTAGWIESEKRFYLIAVKELTAESTTVAIVSKIQFECKAPGSGVITNIEACRDKTKVHWPLGKERDISTMEMFHNFLQNNLIAAGLL